MTDDYVLLGHGSGGAMSKRMIDDIFIRTYGSPELLSGDDSAVLPCPTSGEKLATSTDSFVVHPHFFPGGDIGKLAVCGTVNDLTTSGAVPYALSIAFILEEGFALHSLERICQSIAKSAQEADVRIVTGDTKVVSHGQADGIFITTAGIGIIPPHLTLSGRQCQPGDVVIVSGSLGDHGIAILAQRENLSFSTSLCSDVAPLNHMAQKLIDAAPHLRALRDPTRGGLASTLNEFAAQSGVDILIKEDALPIKDEVRGACDMLGLDVLQVANEGKLVCVVPADEAESALAALRSDVYGTQSAIIGTIEPMHSHSPLVYVENGFGGRRILTMLVGEQLPRIC